VPCHEPESGFCKIVKMILEVLRGFTSSAIPGMRPQGVRGETSIK